MKAMTRSDVEHYREQQTYRLSVTNSDLNTQPKNFTVET